MTLIQQPPEKPKDTTPEKPGGETRQNPGKTEDKPTPNKDAPAKTGQEAVPNQDQLPLEQQQPVIPLQPPPGAQIAVPPKEQPKNFRIGSILEPALWLIAILTVGALLLAWLKKNRDRQAGALALTAHDQLTAFRDSMDEGDMTEEEFKKVKALLAEKIRKPAKPVATATGQDVQSGEATATTEPKT